MNKKREKVIRDIMKGMNAALDAKDFSDSTLKRFETQLNRVLDDEQEAYDNIPESLQLSDRAMRSEECIELLEDAISMLDTPDDNPEDSLLAAYDSLEEIFDV